MHLFTVLGRQCVEGLNESHYHRCRRNQKKQQKFARFSHVATSCKPDILFSRTTRLKKYFDGEGGSTASIRFAHVPDSRTSNRGTRWSLLRESVLSERFRQ